MGIVLNPLILINISGEIDVHHLFKVRQRLTDGQSGYRGKNIGGMLLKKKALLVSRKDRSGRWFFPLWSALLCRGLP